ncbi:MAG: sulfite exporter TauE/SafE family protein [Pirellulales bacterium]
MVSELALILCIFLAAMLYSSVGHGGASGYLAAMALFNLAPEAMRPAALTLNVFVATIGVIQFYRAGCFSHAIFWPFALASIPAAALGGAITLPSKAYKAVVGVVLLAAAVRFAWRPVADTAKPVPLALALVCGAGIGLLSGLTGTGGGIFLSPLLLVMGWAETKQSAGVSAAFILANSIAGIIGLCTKPTVFPAMLPYWIVAVVAGGLIGSGLGSRRLANPTLRRLLAVVLVIAGLKLIFA